MKSYNIEDLFHLKWAALTAREHAAVLYYTECLKKSRAKETRNERLEGHYSILILRTLRKNKKVVSKITVEQVVDCINDIDFINEPWYHFPVLKTGYSFMNSLQPPELLKHHTFGMLCRMDSIFSKWMMKQESQHLQNQLLGLIYTNPADYLETEIEARGEAVGKIVSDYDRIVAIATFANVKKFIIDGCPILFPQSEEATEGPTKEPKLIDSEPMWEKLLFILAETPAYPGMEKAKAAPMYEALNYLEAKALDIENSRTKPTAA